MNLIIPAVAVASLASMGAVFTIPATDATAIGTAATDIAKSLIGVLGDLLPVLVPLLVVGFILGFIISVVRKR